MTNRLNTVQTQESEHGIARRVAKNSVFLLISTGFGLLTSIALIPIVARYLGLESFGLYSLILAISMAITPLANFGIDRIVCRELAKGQVNNETYFSTTIIARGTLSLLLFATACVSIALFSPWEFYINIALLFGISEQLFFELGQTCLSAMRAFERMEFDVLAIFVYKLCLIGFILTAIIFEWGLAGVFCARFASSAVLLLVAVILIYRLFIKPSFYFDSTYIKHLLKESIPVGLFTLLLTLNFRIDVFLLKWFGSEADIALFEVPHRLSSQMQILATSICLAVFPILSRGSLTTINDSLQVYYRTTYKFLFFIGVLLALLLYVGGEPLVVILFGNEFKEAAISMRILSPIVLFNFTILLQTSFLIAVGKQKLNIVAISISLIINTFLGIILIPKFSYVGAGIGTLISYFSFMVISAELVRRQGITLNFAGNILKLILIVFIMYWVSNVYLINDLTTLILRICVCIGIFIILLFILQIITKEEFMKVKGMFERKRRILDVK